MAEVATVELNTGIDMPVIGFGTWQITPNSAAEEAVSEALKTGYRLIDTAKLYGNEAGVGRAIKNSSIKREELFITTKLWNNDQGYDSTFDAFESSLDRLGLDYLDLYLIHWPATDKRLDSYKALTEILTSGRSKAIGVSNYTIRHLEELLGRFDVVPAVNQVEFHPFIYEQQRELLNYCQEKGIVLEAYSPLARAERMNDQLLIEIGQAHSKTPAQVMLRWGIQHGCVVIPRSTNSVRIKDNFNVFDFQLSDSEMDKLNRLSDNTRVSIDPTDIP